MTTINGKVVLVTGANSGLGKATATGLAKLGATVVMVCRSQERGEAARKEIIAASGSDTVELMPSPSRLRGSDDRLQHAQNRTGQTPRHAAGD
jgi:NAD(P)-dependent dehydrogenase (short-subunit alcohol dehydrogenase family)